MMQESDSGATRSHGTRRTVAVVESCTVGLLMARLVGIPESGDWFKGGLVAYHPEVKFDLLGVDPGPVVTAPAAVQMAEGVRRLLGAEIGHRPLGWPDPKPRKTCLRARLSAYPTTPGPSRTTFSWRAPLTRSGPRRSTLPSIG
jgi:hypothetical protein